MISNGLRNRQAMRASGGEGRTSELSKIEMDIKPLVQVDPSVLASTNRTPLRNPRPGDYLLNKAPSTEGIASKKSLELKKRYLLGESGSTGLMKSGSTSVLDSTFKNFHSNISQCQKLLNPSSDISPTMQMFLKQTNRLSGGTKEDKKEIESNRIDEKINVYGMNNNLREIAEKSIDEEHVMPTETINTALVENKLKDFISNKSNDPMDIPIVDLTNVDLPADMIRANQEFIDKLECSEDVENNKVIEVIDLTIESAPMSLDKKTDDQIVPAESLSSVKSKIEADKSAIDTLLRQRDINDVQETTIQVPVLNSWEPKKKPKSDSDVESDSLSNSSSTSSLEEIPHYILDSTTSPDTQANERFVPRLEVRDTTGELMQIDSLMIIDGKYIGDPEDLKLLEKLPDVQANEPQSASECDISCNSEVKRNVSKGMGEVLRRNDSFKFDTRNKSKIESLKNLPLNLEDAATPQSELESPIVDRDKTPTAHLAPGFIGHSDSETEITGQVLTETELSDWTADDAVSENFVDIEFALNSNKGTIKRNKKAKKKTNHPPETRVQQQLSDGDLESNIMKSFDIDNIEFMDTGSDGGCVETYSTTNKGMLRNRGYVEFVDQVPEHVTNRYCPSYRSDTGYSSSSRINLGGGGYSKPEPSVPKEIPGVDYIEQGACVLSSSSEGELKTPVNEITKSVFTDTSSSQVKTQDSEQHSSLNEIEDDSLVLITSQTTTTEDSEALTVVTSPLDSADKNAVEQSFGEAVKAISKDDPHRNTPDEMSYEDYVRKLQMKISQISNSRDSIDVKKSKRRSSKGETTDSCPELPSPTGFAPKLSIFDDNIKEPPTLTKKLEEITKERAKQKDLIHDLVMDKLQTKKQLNAEKRLNRSRSRQIGGTSGSLALSGLASIDIPHCHPVPVEKRTPSKVFEPLQSPSKVLETTLSAGDKLKDRPLSENVESKFGGGILPVSPKKLTKTQSFCGYSSRLVSKESDLIAESFKTPIPPPRSARRIDDKTLAQSEKLRQDARARARLKSNEDLGLSPEEKMQMLRKRYQLDLADSPNKSDDAKVREQKLMASKSVSDISTANSFVQFEKSIDGSDSAGKSSTTTRKFFKGVEFTSDSNLTGEAMMNDKTPNGKKESPKRSDRRSRSKDPERRKSIIQTVSDFFHKKKDSKDAINQINKDKADGVFGLFKLSSKHKEKSKSCFDVRELMISCEKENSPSYSERSKSEDCLKADWRNRRSEEELTPPPIPPLPLNYQRSDDESTSVAENRELKRLKAMSKASRQAELKRLRIAQEIQREQEEIEVQIKELEARGVIIEKVLRGEGSFGEYFNANDPSGASDEKYLKELLEIWRNITQLKKRDQELGIREQELKLEHRHAQLKEQLNMRLSCSKLDKSSADVAAEGAILNEMLEIVAKRAALRPTDGLPTTDEI